MRGDSSLFSPRRTHAGWRTIWLRRGAPIRCPVRPRKKACSPASRTSSGRQQLVASQPDSVEGLEQGQITATRRRASVDHAEQLDHLSAGGRALEPWVRGARQVFSQVDHQVAFPVGPAHPGCKAGQHSLDGGGQPEPGDSRTGVLGLVWAWQGLHLSLRWVGLSLRGHPAAGRDARPPAGPGRCGPLSGQERRTQPAGAASAVKLVEREQQHALLVGAAPERGSERGSKERPPDRWNR